MKMTRGGGKSQLSVMPFFLIDLRNELNQRAILNFTPGPRGKICPLGGMFTLRG
jgi:hypothetical protein